MGTISKSTVVDNVWKEFKDDIASGVTTVTLTDLTTQTIQTYTESFPQSIIDETSDYPIIVIEPPKINWDEFTLTKKTANGTIRIEVYSTKAEAADRFLDKVIDTVETNRANLRTSGLYMVNLDSTDNDNVPKGDIRIHMRSSTFTFKYNFTKTVTW